MGGDHVDDIGAADSEEVRAGPDNRPGRLETEHTPHIAGHQIDRVVRALVRGNYTERGRFSGSARPSGLNGSRRLSAPAHTSTPPARSAPIGAIAR